ncbi:MAG: esterase-like activity of phytase family protein [Cyanobacteria bacterium P01_A01_bin.114]
MEADAFINAVKFYTQPLLPPDGTQSSCLKVTFLLDKNGKRFESGSLDPEGIAIAPQDMLYVSSEGDADQLITPFIREIGLEGQFLSELSIPDLYLPTADQSSGVRNNLAFESLTLTSDH